jgi:hypothetical protein
MRRQERATSLRGGFARRTSTGFGDPADLEVIVDVLITDAALVRKGAKILLERSGGSSALRGQVRRIEPFGFTKVSALGVEEQRVWIIVDITSPREAAWRQPAGIQAIDGTRASETTRLRVALVG